MVHRHWPVVVRLHDIEHAPVDAAGRFAEFSIVPVGIPPLLSRWLASFCVNTTDPIVALTFDDGPHPVHTPAILDLLADRGATATFFVLAPQVEAHPDIARRIVADGHEIALHGVDHRSLLTMTAREAVHALRSARRRVEEVVGGRIRLYRPPYGEYTWQQTALLRLQGLETVVWSSDSRDWEFDDHDVITQHALSNLFAGGIVLFHDNRGDPDTLPAGTAPSSYDRASVLEAVLDRLDATGYRTRQVGEMLSLHQRVRSVARYGADRLHPQTATT